MSVERHRLWEQPVAALIFLTPVITGAMVGLWGVRIAYVYVIIMSAVSILAAIVLRMNTSEEEDL